MTSSLANINSEIQISSGIGAAIAGYATSLTNTSAVGIYGNSKAGRAVSGLSDGTSGYGGHFTVTGSTGQAGYFDATHSSGANYGIYSVSASNNGMAGYFRNTNGSSPGAALVCEAQNATNYSFWSKGGRIKVDNQTGTPTNPTGTPVYLMINVDGILRYIPMYT
jgi:hypothetical protein